MANLKDFEEELHIQPDVEILDKIKDHVVEIVSGREYQTKLPAGDQDNDTEFSKSESEFKSEHSQMQSAAEKSLKDLSTKLGIQVDELIH